MKRLACLSAIALTCLSPATPAFADYFAGVQNIVVTSEEREAPLDVIVWYPALPGGEAVSLGGNVFFEGTEAMRHAPIAPGAFPLILLSHGAGLAGRAEAMSWIATQLAENGFIVAAPTHPGNTGADRSAAQTMQLWLRPSDLSATLDTLEDGTSFRPHINFDEIGVLGLSMGGNTALSMAGARLDADLFARYCDSDDLNASLCEWVRSSGVDLRAMDRSLVERDNRDSRVHVAMAIDPALADTFETDAFDRISIPVTLVNLGLATDIPVTVQAAGIAASIPGAGYQVIENAEHASMFAECKPGA